MASQGQRCLNSSGTAHMILFHFVRLSNIRLLLQNQNVMRITFFRTSDILVISHRRDLIANTNLTSRCSRRKHKPNQSRQVSVTNDAAGAKSNKMCPKRMMSLEWPLESMLLNPGNGSSDKAKLVTCEDG